MSGLRDLTPTEGTVMFALTLAWCEDVHTSMFALTEAECDVAEALRVEVEAAAEDTDDPLVHGAAMMLACFVDDCGEGDLPEAQWDAVEALHGRLSGERGHVARRGDGSLIAA